MTGKKEAKKTTTHGDYDPFSFFVALFLAPLRIGSARFSIASHASTEASGARERERTRKRARLGLRDEGIPSGAAMTKKDDKRSISPTFFFSLFASSPLVSPSLPLLSLKKIAPGPRREAAAEAAEAARTTTAPAAITTAPRRPALSRSPARPLGDSTGAPALLPRPLPPPSPPRARRSPSGSTSPLTALSRAPTRPRGCCGGSRRTTSRRTCSSARSGGRRGPRWTRSPGGCGGRGRCSCSSSSSSSKLPQVVVVEEKTEGRGRLWLLASAASASAASAAVLRGTSSPSRAEQEEQEEQQEEEAAALLLHPLHRHQLPLCFPPARPTSRRSSSAASWGKRRAPTGTSRTSRRTSPCGATATRRATSRGPSPPPR